MTSPYGYAFGVGKDQQNSTTMAGTKARGAMTEAEYARARYLYLRRQWQEREQRARIKGHTFTRRTYRVARRRAIRKMLDAAAFPMAETPALVKLREMAISIVARGRREKGMWRG